MTSQKGDNQQPPPFIPYQNPTYEGLALQERVEDFYQLMSRRRSLRMFSDKSIPKEVIERIIMTASSAPSGAHKQPWTFCAISSPEVKTKIRKAAEEEEYTNYHGRMSDAWLDDLKVFGTDEHKPFLEIAPWLIVVCKRAYEEEEGEKKNNYYVTESVGIATGVLLTAIHHAGLVALTHTPSPMNFLTKVLNRPANERPFLLIPVGYPADDAEVPDIQRKPPEDVIVYYE
ncbi:MAG: nitroreductase family protein [Bacteroidota bacterium]